MSCDDVFRRVLDVCRYGTSSQLREVDVASCVVRRTSDGGTLLSEVCRRSDEAVPGLVRTLLDAGAVPEPPALAFACRWSRDRVTVAALIDARASPLEVDCVRVSPLMECCRVARDTRDVEVGRELLAAGSAVLTQEDEDGHSPLSHACTNLSCPVELVHLVTLRDVINRPDKSTGVTPLMAACRHPPGDNNRLTVEHLVLQGADGTAKDHRGRTALHYCCVMGNTWAAQHLVTTWPHLVNTRDHLGRTALLWACWLRRRDTAPLVRYLLEAGADPNVVTWRGERPLEVSCQSEVVSALAWSRGGPLVEPWTDWDQREPPSPGDVQVVHTLLRVDVLTALLEHGCHVNHRLPGGDWGTLLHKLLRWTHLTSSVTKKKLNHLLRLYVASGGHLDIPNCYGVTADCLLGEAAWWVTEEDAAKLRSGSLSLQCLSARRVALCPRQLSALPRKLRQFVELHQNPRELAKADGRRVEHGQTNIKLY